jgi:hypothetical protein
MLANTKGLAVVRAKLVDMRNVAEHSCLKLTLHIPMESALAAIDAFGWPTGAQPVDVAVAALDVHEEGERAEATNPNVDNTQPSRLENRREQPAGDERRASPAAPPLQPRKESTRSWNDVPASQQAGMLCKKEVFWKFLERYTKGYKVSTSDQAADVVRMQCGVQSRGELHPDHREWRELLADYEQWLYHPELG